MFDNKFDQYRTEVCLEIGKIRPFSYFRTFLNILLYAPLSDPSWKTKKCRPEDLRGGALSIRHFTPINNFNNVSSSKMEVKRQSK